MTVETWNRLPPPGFAGLRSDVPVTFYYRHLPHWRQDGATYFVTFRLADSLPQSKLRELEAIRREFMARHGMGRTECHSVPREIAPRRHVPHDVWEAFCREQMRRVERWLDQGMGNCHLKRPDIAKVVVEALHHFDGSVYELGCYIVMPNHVHTVIRPLTPDTDPLEKILQSRKRRMTQQVNSKLGDTGTLRQEESFDRIVRDEEHLYRCIQYIGDNSCRAGLKQDECPRWIRPAWVELGWRFEE